MDAKGITAITGFVATPLCGIGALLSAVQCIRAGSIMNDYLRDHHPERLNQLESVGWVNMKNERLFYMLDSNYENDPIYEPIKKRTQKWYWRFFSMIGVMAATIFGTFIVELLLQGK